MVIGLSGVQFWGVISKDDLKLPTFILPELNDTKTCYQVIVSITKKEKLKI